MSGCRTVWPAAGREGGIGFARADGMRLVFDRGTVLLLDATNDLAADLPGMLWDPRVAAYRAPAWRHRGASFPSHPA